MTETKHTIADVREALTVLAEYSKQDQNENEMLMLGDGYLVFFDPQLANDDWSQQFRGCEHQIVLETVCNTSHEALTVARALMNRLGV